MRKLKNVLLSVLFAFAFAMCFVPSVLFNTTNFSFADTPTNITKYDMSLPLFNALVGKKIAITGEDAVSFESDYFSTPENFVGLDDDLANGILDLSGKNLDDVSGLNLLDLSGIKTLVLSNNYLSEIKSSYFSTMPSLETIKVDGNLLTSCKFGDSVKNSLKNIDLHNNNLTGVDLTNLTKTLNVDLSVNCIEDIAEIKMPSNISQINLAFNNITDITVIPTFSGVEANMEVQGLAGVKNSSGQRMSNFLAGRKIVVVSTVDKVVGYTVEYSSNSSFSGTILQENGEVGIKSFLLPAGKISLSFSAVAPFTLNDNYATRNLQVALPKPTYTAVVNGKTVENLVQEKPITLSFDMVVNSNLANYQKVQENATLKVESGSSTLSASNINISKNGNYSLMAYVVFDGVSSQTLFVSVKMTNTQGSSVAIILIAIVAVGVATAMFLVKWLRAGGSVAPLNEREVSRINRRLYKSGSEDRLTITSGTDEKMGSDPSPIDNVGGDDE